MTNCECEWREVVIKLHVSNKVSVQLYFSLRCDGHASARFLLGLTSRITNVYFQMELNPNGSIKNCVLQLLQTQEANMGADRRTQHQKLSERKEN